MPVAIVLPDAPTVQFAVFDHWGRIAVPGSTDKCRVGWGITGSRDIFENQTQAEYYLPQKLDQWKRRCRELQYRSLFFEDVLAGLVITHVTPGYNTLVLAIPNDEQVVLRPVRWRSYPTPVMEGEAPFTVVRVLKDQRTLRCADGKSIIFPGKMRIERFPDSIIKKYYPD